MLVLGRPFQPSLLFEGKAGAHLVQHPKVDQLLGRQLAFLASVRPDRKGLFADSANSLIVLVLSFITLAQECIVFFYLKTFIWVEFKSPFEAFYRQKLFYHHSSTGVFLPGKNF
jgi:hypothetical protein